MKYLKLRIQLSKKEIA